MHLCSYSASSSDNETEADLASTENGTGAEELFHKVKHNKNGKLNEISLTLTSFSQVLGKMFLRYGSSSSVLTQFRADVSQCIFPLFHQSDSASIHKTI